MPEAEDGLVDYFRSISGEHPDWDEYRAAMRVQDKSLLRITPTRWSPIATGSGPCPARSPRPPPCPSPSCSTSSVLGTGSCSRRRAATAVRSSPR